ncbi:MAG TPA: lycopene cyclase family protein [Euzebyales bacterium]
MAASDVLVLGAGPAGRAAAAACVQAGLGVHLLAPAPHATWTQTYGAWLDELGAAGFPTVAGHQWDTVLVRTSQPALRPVGRTYALIDNDRLRTTLTDRARDATTTAGRARELVTAGDRLVVTTTAGERLAARAVIDATGHPRFAGRTQAAGLAYQTAFGIVARFDRPPIPHGTMCLMDLDASAFGDDDPPTFLYAMDLGDGTWLVEETSLAGRPAVPLGLLRRRLEQRLAHLGCTATDVLATERVAFPMDAPVARSGPAVAFGSAAGMIHPATGYHVATALQRAPALAAVLRTALSGGADLHATARAGHRAVWSHDDLRRDALYRFGLDVLLTLDARQTRAFFAGFFALPASDWRSYVSRTASPLRLHRTMIALMARVPADVRRRVVRAVVADGAWRRLGPLVLPAAVSG